MIFDPIKKTDQLSGKFYYMLDDVLGILGVTKRFFAEDVPRKAKAWLQASEIDERKIFRSNLGDWIVTDGGLIGVVAVVMLAHGDKGLIMQAKIEMGLMDPPIPPSPAMLVVHENATPSTPELYQPPALTIFTYGVAQVRVETINGEPWFCLKDSAEVLGIKDHKNFLSSEWCDSNQVCLIPVIDSMGREQQVNFISESNLYALILRSRKKEAIAFQRWVTHDVIPSIRKTGKYEIDQKPSLPTDYKSALVALLAEVEKTEAQQTVIRELTPKAEFHDTVADATNCHSFQEAGKILGIGQNRLFAFCYENGMLIKKSRLPYQRFNDDGYFKVIEEPYEHPRTGEQRMGYKTVITGKGLTYLERKLKENLKAA